MRSQVLGILVVSIIFSGDAFAQTNAPDGWLNPDWNKPAITNATRKPAPRRSLVGMWGPAEGPGAGTQASGVQLKPNNGKPENELPYTPYGLQVYRSHKPLEGKDSVDPADNNDPRTKCEPLGFPRYNHYDLGIQVFQDEHKIAMLYNFDNRWRMIWTDGRPLPKVVDGGVEIDGEYREARWMGYSVGRWIDDYTLEVITVGTMPEDRVWLDNTGRPISDKARITERFHRLDNDTLEWSETIDDPKIYTRPWDTLKLRMTLQDSRIDLMTRYCSPVEIDNYNKTFGDAAGAN